MPLTVEKKSEEKLSFYHAKPLGLLMKRTVLIIGMTGVGKSTITNVLVNQSVAYPQLCRPAKTDNTRSLVTSKSKIFFNGNLTVIDSPGLYGLEQDEKFDNGEAIKEFILQLNSGISTVLIVQKAGRAIDATLQMETLMRKLFGKFFGTHCVLVLTHCSDSVEVHRNANLQKDPQYVAYLDSFAKVITVNLEKHTNEKMDQVAMDCYRAPALKALSEVILIPKEKLYVRPGFFERAFLLAVQTFSKTQADVEKYCQLTKTEQFYVGGECSICSEELLGDKFMLPCSHIFHFDCFSAWHTAKLAEDEPTTCPDCRADCTEMTMGVRETDKEEMETRRVLKLMTMEGNFEVKVRICSMAEAQRAATTRVTATASTVTTTTASTTTTTSTTTAATTTTTRTTSTTTVTTTTATASTTTTTAAATTGNFSFQERSIRELLVTVHPTSTIQQLKIMLSRQCGVNMEGHVVLMAGNRLQNTSTIASCGIESGGKEPMLLHVVQATTTPTITPPKRSSLFSWFS